MRKIILITGGQRSGKSSFAEKMALDMSDNPVYIATAKVWDEEFRQRVEQHKANRGLMWKNIEEEKLLSLHKVEGRVVLIDCVTLWATNFFFDESKKGKSEPEVKTVLEKIQREFDRFTNQEATFIFVTNEIGCGEISSNKIQRKFTDIQGWLNQYIAKKSDKVILMVSGIPVTIKNNLP